MAQRIAVIGTGYVGLIQAVGLADFGNYVTGVDISEEIAAKLSAGTPTIFEHGLTEYLQRNLESGRLRFTTDIAAAVGDADVVFITVGTPQAADGSADLSQVWTVADSIREHARGFTVVATNSTVPVGTSAAIAARLGAAGPVSRRFAVASNPEFLREGRAVQDFFHPDRVVIGLRDDTPEDARAREILEEIYRPLYLLSTPFVWTTPETAELIKYASNAFLATKITFINQVANLAEAVGADVHVISRAMGMDGRISGKFLHPGPGYGGSCFPKDTRAVVAMGEKAGVSMSLLQAVVSGNEAQKQRTAEKVIRAVKEAGGSTVAVLGVAFKAETDDVRESPALTIVPALLEAGLSVRVHDPKALETFRQHMGDHVTYHRSAPECLEGADCALILTEWNEYRNLDLPRAAGVMAGRLIVDTRNVLDPEDAAAAGFTYMSTGRGTRRPGVGGAATG